MTSRIADDFADIKARMEEIAKERAQAPAEHALQTAVEQYLAGGSCESASLKTQDLPYLGWDIYAPVNLS